MDHPGEIADETDFWSIADDQSESHLIHHERTLSTASVRVASFPSRSWSAAAFLRYRSLSTGCSRTGPCFKAASSLARFAQGACFR
jgi:hypothetical protein